MYIISKKYFSILLIFALIFTSLSFSTITVQADDSTVGFVEGDIYEIGEKIDIQPCQLVVSEPIDPLNNTYKTNILFVTWTGIAELQYVKFINGGKITRKRHIFKLIYDNGMSIEVAVYDDKPYKPYGVKATKDRGGNFILTAVYHDFEGVEIKGFNGKYDGKPHGISISVANPPSGYSISYGASYRQYYTDESLVFTDIGEHNVYYKIAADGYNTIEGCEKVIIERLDLPLQVVMKDWIYGEEPFQPVVPEKYNPENEWVFVSYKERGANDSTYSFDVPQKAGDYTLRVHRLGLLTYKEAIITKDFKIFKATPYYDIPNGITAKYGVTLASVPLPNGWSWVDDKLSVGNAGVKHFFAVYTPNDTDNYYSVTVAVPVKVIETNEKARAKFVAGLSGHSTKNAIELKWSKAPKAERYVIYATYCDKNKKTKYEKIKTVNNKTTQYTIKKLQGKKLCSKKNVKVYLVAYEKRNGKYNKLFKTDSIHIAGYNTRYSNVKSINVAKDKYSLKVDKTAKIKPSIILENKQKKPLIHVNKYRFVSTDKSVVQVSKDGKMTTKGKGKANVYVYSNNGTSKSINIIVK